MKIEQQQRMLNKIYLIGDEFGQKLGKINGEIAPTDYLLEQFDKAIQEVKEGILNDFEREATREQVFGDWILKMSEQRFDDFRKRHLSPSTEDADNSN